MRRPTGLPAEDSESGLAPAFVGSAREVVAVDEGATRASLRWLGSVGSMAPLEHGGRKVAKGSLGYGRMQAKNYIKEIFVSLGNAHMSVANFGVKGLVALGATLVLALTGCSAGTQGLSDSSAGDDSSSSGKSPSTSSDADGQESSALGACSEEDGCLSTGFTVASDGFSFANWQGEGNLDVDSMIMLFGRSDVCAEGSGEECELLPAAQQWLTQANSSLSSGRCEGFAVLSQSLYDGVYALSELNGTAQVTADLRHSSSATAVDPPSGII